jgi:hypothetical protein
MLSWLLLLGVFLGIISLRYSKKAANAAGQQKVSDPNKVTSNSNAVSDQKSSSKSEKDKPGKKQIRPPDHDHPAFSERTYERKRMVDQQIKASGWDVRTPVRDPNVLKAMRTVPRHMFVHSSDLRRAYGDHPLGKVSLILWHI